MSITKIGKKTKRQRVLFTAAFFLFIIILFFSAYYLSHYVKSAGNGPVLELPMETFLPQEAFFLYGQGTVFSTAISDYDLPDAQLMVRTEHQWLDIYLNEELIFSTPRAAPNEDPGLGRYHVPLSDYAEKELYIVVNSPTELFESSLQDVYFGSSQALQTFIITSSLPYLFLMFLCITGGITLTLLSLLSPFSGSINYSNFFLGLFSIVWGLNSTTDLLISYTFLSPVFLSNAAILLHYLNPLPLALFLYFRMQQYRKWATPFVLLLCFAFIAAFAAPLFNINYVNITEYLNPVYQGIFLCFIILCILEMSRGNVFIKKIVPFATPLLMITIIQVIDFYTYSFSTSKIRLISYICYFILIVGVWILSCVDFYQLWRKNEAEMNAMQLRNTMITTGYAAILSKHEDVLTIKHEMQHIFTAVQILLKKPDVEEAKRFLAQVSSRSFFREDAFSENHLINAIITEANNRASQNAIRCQWNIDVPEDLQLNINTLSSVLMNLLDNALEASVFLPSQQREIELTMYVKNNHLFIQCKNAAKITPAMQKGHFATTKKSASNHGLGLLIIHRLVEENGGLIKIDVDKSYFIANLALLLAEDTPGEGDP